MYLKTMTRYHTLEDYLVAIRVCERCMLDSTLSRVSEVLRVDLKLHTDPRISHEIAYIIEHFPEKVHNRMLSID